MLPSGEFEIIYEEDFRNLCKSQSYQIGYYVRAQKGEKGMVEECERIGEFIAEGYDKLLKNLNGRYNVVSFPDYYYKNPYKDEYCLSEDGTALWWGLNVLYRDRYSCPYLPDKDPQ
ncbi:MAG: hypothetical protein IPO78_10310 [Saprospiraceae bacterium]|nr:hypothetical protein [Saprospiraceae bacterium]